MADTRHFDELIGENLRQAAFLSQSALEMVRDHIPEDCIFGTMPQASVYRLHLVATGNYRGALSCLGWPETSFSAVLLLRGMFEAWSHLDFIADDSQGGEARCRAVRYERGIRRVWSAIATGPLAGMDLGDWRQHHQAAIKEIESLAREFGCDKAAARTNRQVEPTLRVITARPQMDWVLPVWRSTSAIAHVQGPDFVLGHNPDGSTKLDWAKPSDRAFWFRNIVVTFSNLTNTAVLCLSDRRVSIDGSDLHAFAVRTSDNEDLNDAMSGRWD